MEADETVMIAFRVPPELKKAFEAATKANDRTGSQILRDFVRDYIKQNRQGSLLK